MTREGMPNLLRSLAILGDEGVWIIASTDRWQAGGAREDACYCPRCHCLGQRGTEAGDRL